VRAFNESNASISADIFFKLSTEQMRHLMPVYQIAWEANKGGCAALTVLNMPRWVQATRNADVALKAIWWVFSPYMPFDRHECRKLACVIRDALRRGVAPENFLTEGERNLAVANIRGSR
jgi:hypothetical protein